MDKLLKRLVLHRRIELRTSPLPRHRASVQALISFAFLP